MTKPAGLPPTFLLVGLLAALAALGPFCIDTYMPAFPGIAVGLGASMADVQQSLTAYMLPLTLMSLWHGPFSDALGRRKAILVSLLVFILATLLCMLAGSIQVLWLGRVLQGATTGAGFVVGQAVIRDMAKGADAQRLLARVALIFSLTPAVSAMLGGWVYAHFGWRAVFAFLGLVGVVLFWLCWRHLPETLPREERHSLRPGHLMRASGRVMSSGAFVLLAVAIGSSFDAFFNYILSAPMFLMQHLGLGPEEFGWLFLPTVAGMMLGSYLSAHLAGRLSPGRTIAAGYGVMVLATLLNLAICRWLPAGVPQSVIPVSLYGVGMALVTPSLTLLALDLFPDRRGLAASCLSFLHSCLTSLSAAFVVPLLKGAPALLALGMVLYLSLSAAAFLGYRRRVRCASV
jgi:DHA1 family bicyclomycin/chloramphenicol resistance-like MFS transporter